MGQLIIISLITILVSSCSLGEYQDASGSCLQCEISCNSCQSSDGCSTCYDQMFLATRGNLIICDLCYNINRGCSTCVTSTKCSSCLNGYLLQQDNTCVPCSSLLSNCLLCQSTTAPLRCITCNPPYFLTNGQCLQNNPQSRVISAQSHPVLPQQGSSLCDASQVEVKGACYPTIAFCLAYSGVNGLCISCHSIFALSNGICLPTLQILSSNAVASPTQPSGGIIPIPSNNNVISQNCAVFNNNDSTKCSKCLEGYHLIEDLSGICYSIN